MAGIQAILKELGSIKPRRRTRCDWCVVFIHVQSTTSEWRKGRGPHQIAKYVNMFRREIEVERRGRRLKPILIQKQTTECSKIIVYFMVVKPDYNYFQNGTSFNYSHRQFGLSCPDYHMKPNIFDKVHHVRTKCAVDCVKRF